MEGASDWQELKNSEGRAYFYNKKENKTQWEKPIELMTASERAASDSAWKEYKNSEGRPYFYNLITKKTTWEMPDALKNAAAAGHQLPAIPPPQSNAPTFVSAGSLGQPDSYRPRDRDDHYPGSHAYDRATQDRPTGYTGPSALASQAQPAYATAEQAEAAFFELLRQHNVDDKWTWDQTMLAVIKEPQYKAIKLPADRKAAFEKYVADFRAQAEQQEQDRAAQFRMEFTAMLSRRPEIKHYSQWKTIRPLIENDAIFQTGKDDGERKAVFEDYAEELWQNFCTEEERKQNLARTEFAALIRTLGFTLDGSWKEYRPVIEANERFRSEEIFRSLKEKDMLDEWIEFWAELARQDDLQDEEEERLRYRRERKNRDGFKELLQELKVNGHINPDTTQWEDIYPLIEDDPRYDALLDNTEGSDPMEFFCDLIYATDMHLKAKRSIVRAVLNERKAEITTSTTLDEFSSIMQSDDRTSSLEDWEIKIIFERFQAKVRHLDEEERHKAEHNQRKAIDDLRSRIKHLKPPVSLTDSWDEVRPRLEKYTEYQTLDDESRRAAFDKHLRRLRDSQREVSDRATDREHRNGNSPRTHTTNGPAEADAYESERKKLEADRERIYSRSGVSPLGHYRDDRDRDRYHDRDHSRPASSHRNYDRRDRERDSRGDRSHSSRADPLERTVNLTYDEGPTVRGHDNDGDEYLRKCVADEQSLEKQHSQTDKVERCKLELRITGSKPTTLVPEPQTQGLVSRGLADRIQPALHAPQPEIQPPVRRSLAERIRFAQPVASGGQTAEGIETPPPGEDIGLRIKGEVSQHPSGQRKRAKKGRSGRGRKKGK